jgi:hypothetical protein
MPFRRVYVSLSHFVKSPGAARDEHFMENPKGVLRRVKDFLTRPREVLTLEDPASQSTFAVVREGPLGAACAFTAFVYSIGVVSFLLWELVDIWSGRFLVMAWLGFDPRACAASTTFKQLAYLVVGGALGSALSGIRSLIFWHCGHRAFEPRFLWRYVTSPLSGAALSLLVQALVRAGTAVLGADLGAASGGGRSEMMLFAVGMLSGYGAEQVTRWLDDHVRRLFRVSGEPTVKSVTRGDTQVTP